MQIKRFFAIILSFHNHWFIVPLNVLSLFLLSWHSGLTACHPMPLYANAAVVKPYVIESSLSSSFGKRVIRDSTRSLKSLKWCWANKPALSKTGGYAPACAQSISHGCPSGARIIFRGLISWWVRTKVLNWNLSVSLEARPKCWHISSLWLNQSSISETFLNGPAL